MNNSAELRQQLDKLLAEENSCKDKRSAADKRLSAIDKEKKEINQRLALSEPGVPHITDHALVRYIERRYKLDIEEIKTEIIPPDPQLLRAIQTLGDGKFPVGNSHRLVVKGNTVISVLPFQD